jgi:nucleoside triphosphate diphosphatase
VKPSRDISRLIEIMAALRTPGSGCPWDLEQSFRTIAPYTIEEAYEVADAIARDDLVGLKDELGDLLLQVVFHARMAQEQGAFDFADVVETITTKLVRRHPHVFADAEGRPPSRSKACGNGSRPKKRPSEARRRQAEHWRGYRLPCPR